MPQPVAPEPDMMPIMKLGLHDRTVYTLLTKWERGDFETCGETLVAMVVALAQEKRDLFERLIRAEQNRGPSWKVDW